MQREKIVSDCEMQMTRHDTVLVVITGGFTAKFKDLGSEVLKNSGLLICAGYITSKSTYLHQYQHSCLPSRDGGYDRQGVGDHLWMGLKVAVLELGQA